MDVRHELEKYVLKLKENQQKIKHFQNEVRYLITHIVEMFES